MNGTFWKWNFGLVGHCGNVFALYDQLLPTFLARVLMCLIAGIRTLSTSCRRAFID
jgi:hypothetical protein